MANVKISALTAASAAAGTNEIPINEAGTTKKVTVTQIGSAILTDDLVKTVTVSFSSAEINALTTTAKQLVAAPGAGKLIVVESYVWALTAGATPFANGGTLVIGYNGTESAPVIKGIAAADVNSATSLIKSVTYGGTTSYIDATSAENQNLTCATDTQFINGNGTFKIYLKYRIITL